jgi:hypothetical protein
MEQELKDNFAEIRKLLTSLKDYLDDSMKAGSLTKLSSARKKVDEIEKKLDILQNERKDLLAIKHNFKLGR